MTAPISPAALLHFFEAICWAVALFVAIAGYGGLLLRVTGLRRPAFTLAAVAGFGFIILLGGMLNLLHAIAVSVLLGIVSFGLLAAGWLFLLNRGTSTRIPPPTPPSGVLVKVLLLLFAAMFGVRMAATVHTPYYQQSDDYNFYLAAPEKMLQLHQYAPDPFSERRIMASVGGNYFLQALVHAELPLEDIQMADRAFGLLLLACLSFGLSVAFGLTPLQRAAAALFVLITPQLQFNLTFVVLPSALFFALVYIAANHEDLEQRPALRAILLGMTVGTVASLKSTYLPHGVFFVLGIAAFDVARRGVLAGLRTFVLGVLGCLLVLAPWMIAQHSATGTYFYPLLGKGFHYSSYGLFAPPSGGNIQLILRKVIPFNIPLTVILLLEWFWGERDEPSRAATLLTLATLLASVFVGIATGGDSVRRYNYPAIVPSILLLFFVFSRKVNLFPKVRRWQGLEAFAAVLAVATAFYIGLNSWTREYAMIWIDLRTSLTDFSIEPPPVRAEYAAAERAIPAGANALATVDDTFLLDYRSRHIDIADFPGAASPPPGWPGRSDGETLARYLQAQHIRYLIYTYHPEITGFEAHLLSVINDPNVTQWIRSEDEMVLLTRRQYHQLADTRKHIYDDGTIYVLDLATPK